jgi:hypothetical protein
LRRRKAGWLKKRVRRDYNHATITRQLILRGASVLDIATLGEGAPDILVGFRGVDRLAEIKNPNTSYGRRGQTDLQKTWGRFWNGRPVGVIRSEADVDTFLAEMEAQ